MPVPTGLRASRPPRAFASRSSVVPSRPLMAAPSSRRARRRRRTHRRARGLQQLRRRGRRQRSVDVVVWRAVVPHGAPRDRFGRCWSCEFRRVCGAEESHRKAVQQPANPIMRPVRYLQGSLAVQPSSPAGRPKRTHSPVGQCRSNGHRLGTTALATRRGSARGPGGRESLHRPDRRRVAPARRPHRGAGSDPRLPRGAPPEPPPRGSGAGPGAGA